MAVLPPLVQVALPLPVATPYTYAVPAALADRVVPGARVVVPVRRREMVGIVVGIDETPPAVEARDILAAPDDEPALPPSLLRTAEWMAGYYGTPLGITLKAMLPGPLWGESEVQLIRLSDAGVGGGTAGELVAWLDRRGGQAPMSAAARAFRKPLWGVADRLVRIGALRLDTESPPTEISRATVRALELAEPRLGLLERDLRFARRP
ncbi:MAG: primosomal protein N' family DNA-binding protein, partial [Gemmatimonadales bacterium]